MVTGYCFRCKTARKMVNVEMWTPNPHRGPSRAAGNCAVCGGNVQRFMPLDAGLPRTPRRRVGAAAKAKRPRRSPSKRARKHRTKRAR